MGWFDYSAGRKQRAANQDKQSEADRKARAAQEARKATERMADKDTTPGQQYRNAKKLRDKTAQALKDQGID